MTTITQHETDCLASFHMFDMCLEVPTFCAFLSYLGEHYLPQGYRPDIYIPGDSLLHWFASAALPRANFYNAIIDHPTLSGLNPEPHAVMNTRSLEESCFDLTILQMIPLHAIVDCLQPIQFSTSHSLVGDSGYIAGARDEPIYAMLRGHLRELTLPARFQEYFLFGNHFAAPVSVNEETSKIAEWLRLQKPAFNSRMTEP